MTAADRARHAGPVWARAAAVFMLLAAVVALFTVRQYGATWDEEHSMTQGAAVIAWYTSGFTDRRVIDDGNYRWYGGLFNVVVQLVHRTIAAGLYETSHALTLVLGLTGVALAYRIGSRLGGPLGGFLSAVFLWLTPIYYGHSFNNPKDIPFAVFSLGFTAALIATWTHLPRPPRAVWVPVGVLLGITMGVRVGGIVNVTYLAGSWFAWLLARHWRVDGLSRRSLMADAWALLVSIVKISTVAWGVMLVCWPYGLVSPIVNPLRSLAATAQFDDWIHPVRFNGTDVMSNRLPWTYIPVWFGVTLPEFYFFAAALGIAQLPELISQGRAGQDNRRVVFGLMLLVMILLPIATAIASHAILYDGVRHLLFVVPPLAIVAGLAVARFLDRVENGRIRIVVVALVGASVAATAIDMGMLHPYQSVYFNRTFGGGLRSAAARFETDYWGQSYKAGVEWLVANYRPEVDRPIRVSNCSKEFLTGYYLDTTTDARRRFRSVAIDAHPDVVLATTRWRCNERIRGQVLHVVERLGVPLCYVVETEPR